MVDNVNSSEVNVILNTVMGDDKGIDDIQKQLEKQLELAIKNGSVKGFKDSSKSIARLNIGKNWYIASGFRITNDGKLDSRTKAKFSKPLSLTESREVYSSKTYKDIENRLKTKYAEQESKRLSKLENKRQLQQKQDIKLEEIKEKRQDDRARKLQFAESWTKIIGGSELDIKKAKLRGLREQLIEIGDEGSDAFQEIKIQAELLSDEINKIESSLKPTAFQKLLNTIKRVGFYRIARNVFRLIENGFKEGIQNLAKFDNSVNKTMSQFTSQFTILSASSAAILEPLIEVLLPFLKLATNLVAGFANQISYLVAKLKGVAKYTKINTDYMKEYAEQFNNLSFDKFEALSNSDEVDISKLYQEVNVSDGLVNAMGDSWELLGFIETALIAIGATKIISWIMSGGISKLSESLTGINGKLLTIAGTVAFVYDLYLVFKEIKDLIKGIIDGSKSLGDIFKSLLKIVVIGLAGAVTLIGLIRKDPRMILGGVIATGIIASMESIKTYADGGLVNSGSLFIAGESGAELVTTMPSGQTGVTNVAQFKQAMLEALYDWSSTNTESGGDIVLNLDGAEIARSKRFTKEMNIRNASLNLR